MGKGGLYVGGVIAVLGIALVLALHAQAVAPDVVPFVLVSVMLVAEIALFSYFRLRTVLVAEDAKLEEAEWSMQEIVEGLSIPTFVLDKQHRITHWNKACEALTGVRKEAMLGTRDQWKAFYPKKRPVLADLMLDGSNDIEQYYPGKIWSSTLLPGTFEAEDFFPHLGHGGTWLNFTSALLRDAKGNIVGAIETVMDVTGRKRAEEGVAHEKAKDEALLMSIGEGLVALNKDGIVTMANAKAEVLLGFPREGLAGKQFADTVAIENEQGERPPHAERIDVCAASGSCTPQTGTTWYYVRTDGSRFPVRVTANVVKVGHKVVGSIIVFHDNTKEKEIDRMKTEFLSVAAHQLRTPLGMMRWTLDMCTPSGGEGMPLDECLATLRECNVRLIGLVDNLLDVSRIDQGRVKNDPVVTDLWEIAKSVVHEAGVDAAHRGVQLVLPPSTGAATATVDPQLFREVVANLVANAVKYNRPQGTVTVRVTNGDGNVRLAVEDTGIGIPQNEQPRIFSKFFRAKNAVQSETQGSGLGLFVVKSYVEQWKGTVAFVSTEGKGTTFTVTLPST